MTDDRASMNFAELICVCVRGKSQIPRKRGRNASFSKSEEWLQTPHRPAKIPAPREAVEVIPLHLDGEHLSEQHVYVSLRREIPIKAQSE